MYREPQWSADESICVRNVNTEILVFTEGVFEKSAQRIVGQKVASIGLSPGSAPHYLLCYVPGETLCSL